MPNTNVSSELRKMAAQLIEAGRLPAAGQLKLWGGMGCGGECALCAQVVTPEQVQYEVEQPRETGTRSYFFHMVCHAAWQLACGSKREV